MGVGSVEKNGAGMHACKHVGSAVIGTAARGTLAERFRVISAIFFFLGVIATVLRSQGTNDRGTTCLFFFF